MTAQLVHSERQPRWQDLLSTTTDADGDALFAHAADDGDIKRTFRAPQGLRAYGWESADTILYTIDGERTVIMRCSVKSGKCASAAELPYTDRIPEPVRTVG